MSSSLGDEVATVISEDFGFKTLGSKVILPSYNESLPFTSLKNLAIHDDKALFAAYSGGKLICGNLQNLRDHVCDNKDLELSLEKTIENVIYLTFHNDDLLVVMRDGSINLFDTSSYQASELTIGTSICDIKLHNSLLIFLDTDGNLSQYNLLTNSTTNVTENVASFDIYEDNVFVLSKQGNFQKYTSINDSIIPQQTWQFPADINNIIAEGNVPTIISALYGNQCLMIFGQPISEDSEDVMYDYMTYLVDIGQEIVFHETFDIAPAYGTVLRYPTYYNITLPNLLDGTEHINVISSSCASEISICDSKDVIQPSQDSERAVLPVSKDSDNDTNPIGVCLDILTTGAVSQPCAGVDSIGQLPLIYILNSEGNLQIVGLYHASAIKENNYHVNNLQKVKKQEKNPQESPNLTNLILENSEERKKNKESTGTTAFDQSFKTDAENPFLPKSDSTVNEKVPSFSVSASGQDALLKEPSSAFGTPAFGKLSLGDESKTVGFTEKTPTFGTSPFGQTSVSSDRPSFGSVSFGQTSISQDKPTFEAPAFGAPAFGSPSFGQTPASLDKPTSGAPTFGAPSFGQTTASPDKPSFGTPSFGQNSFAQGKPIFGMTSTKQSKPQLDQGSFFAANTDKKSPFATFATFAAKESPFGNFSATDSAFATTVNEQSPFASLTNKESPFAKLIGSQQPHSTSAEHAITPNSPQLTEQKIESPIIDEVESSKETTEAIGASDEELEVESSKEMTEESSVEASNGELEVEAEAEESSEGSEENQNTSENFDDTTVEQSPFDVAIVKPAGANLERSSIASLTDKIKKSANIESSSVSMPTFHADNLSKEGSKGGSPFSAFTNKLNEPSTTTLNFNTKVPSPSTKPAFSFGIEKEESTEKNHTEGDEENKVTEASNKILSGEEQQEDQKEQAMSDEPGSSSVQTIPAESTIGQAHAQDSMTSLGEVNEGELSEFSIEQLDDIKKLELGSEANKESRVENQETEKVPEREKRTDSNELDKQSSVGTREHEINDSDFEISSEESILGKEKEEEEEEKEELQASSDVSDVGFQSKPESADAHTQSYTPITVSQSTQVASKQSYDVKVQTEPVQTCDFEMEAFEEDESYLAELHKPKPLRQYFIGAKLPAIPFSSNDPTMSSFESTYHMITAEFSVLECNVSNLGDFLLDQSTLPLNKRTERSISNMYTWRIPEIEKLKDILTDHQRKFSETNLFTQTLDADVVEFKSTFLSLEKTLAETKEAISQLNWLRNKDLDDKLAPLALHQTEMKTTLRQKMAETSAKIAKIDEALNVMKIYMMKNDKLDENPLVSKLVAESVNTTKLLDTVRLLRDEVARLQLSSPSDKAEELPSLKDKKTPSIATVEASLTMNTKRQLGQFFKKINASLE
ncbi:hypothetical protein KAFR_0J01560 [Kazachstania africana CBS 2517]|uniref:Nucleoporin Nup159/Nup146 N-terminal domain-containing protein n=1 Tax=Kazachstania africana (strain ATCC 22294 / BCRC 22015 / CBS 2517 / CECT 1963 / NBRC 1671 / NRRL Y-8276) TaxID=1071382 RepID=H2B0S2_KAZAF|nr:hypothetical protein KAFR_0J01560 [Kazachstania africana CBS 2517]CCF60222.1 hypothetical protein KAFR_0J01560 [Kazachstania africana CBS 2517]